MHAPPVLRVPQRSCIALWTKEMNSKFPCTLTLALWWSCASLGARKESQFLSLQVTNTQENCCCTYTLSCKCHPSSAVTLLRNVKLLSTFKNSYHENTSSEVYPWAHEAMFTPASTIKCQHPSQKLHEFELLEGDGRYQLFRLKEQEL